jgi:hypothetical protein
MADQSPVSLTPSQTGAGLNLSSSSRNIRPGQLSYALNAVVESFDGQGISYQDELGNTLVVSFGDLKVIGKKAILERNMILVWLTDPVKGGCEIGKVEAGVYTTLISDPGLNFHVDFPILKAFYRIVHCGLEVFWTDRRNPRRYLNLDQLPFKEIPDPSGCGFISTSEVDLNKLLVQPNFSIPFVQLKEVLGDGELTAGTLQFALQYADNRGEGYTSYYSITNPIPVHDPSKITLEFNYTVNKSLAITLTGLDQTSLFDYVNLAVIKTVNNISSYELVGTYLVQGETLSLVYSGQKIANLTEGDIFEKFPIYEKADDIYSVQDVLGWAGMTLPVRYNFQHIANQIKLGWQSYQLRADAYSDPVKAANYKGYMRDEVIPLSFVPLFKNGYQGDHFPIPGRSGTPQDLEVVNNQDAVTSITNNCDTPGEPLPRWKVYNTATVTETHPDYEADNDCYEGPYQSGELAFWQSEDTYPCDKERWGDLAGTHILHPKMPDCSTSPHFSMGGRFIYPLGFRVDVQQILSLIQNADLPQAVKDNLQGFKIVRGNRAHHKSVIAKGIITNVLKYTTQDNIIDPESVASGSAVHETFVQRLISSARSLLIKAKAESGFPISAVDGAIQSAVNGLDTAYNLTPGTDAFTVALKDATDRVNGVVKILSGGWGETTNGTIVFSYVEAAQQVMSSIQDSAEAFAEIDSTTLPTTEDRIVLFPNYLFNDVKGNDPFLANVYADETAKERYCLHSPDTSFYQPNLGSTLKLELALNGLASSQITQVKGHARYQFINSIAYITSLAVGVGVGFASGTYGLSTQPFDGTAAFTAYQTLLDIIRKVAPRKNPAYQLNAVGEYNTYQPVENTGNKQRRLEIAQYLIPGMQSAGDTYKINNYQRESSVYLKTSAPLPFPDELPGVFSDTSKLITGDQSIDVPISAYYASLKNNVPNQWGAMFSYEMVDTGFQWTGDVSQAPQQQYATVFGGDTFINRFAYKSKMPFFLDHRVGVADESDVFYNELSNVGKARYWFSTDANANKGPFGAIFGVRAAHFYQPRIRTFYNEGKIFLFAYGIPYFFCESTVNVDLRQAFNGKEGEFYPHVGTGIPSDWLQEQNVSINQDNTYHYNKTYSKQSKENYFSHLPATYDASCETYQPFLTVYSDPNKWLVYRPASQFEFPQNQGSLTSVDAIENRTILARFENKSQLYNALLTINTSSPQAAYLGNDTLFKSSPPQDLSDTDGGYIGSQHKLFLRTPFGHVFTDAKRGCVFLLQGGQPKNLVTPEVQSFFETHLDTRGDNHFNGKGLHGVYDPSNKRVLITRLDGKNSFTLSYNFLTQSWISFHSYLPNYYVESESVFYSGNQQGLYRHDSLNYHTYYGQKEDYVIEYPISYQFQDELLQSVSDYSQVIRYNADGSYVFTDDWYTKAILFNDQQCSGVRNLNKKPKNSLKASSSFPKYNSDSIDILYTKSNSQYSFNTFWNTLTTGQPIWKPSTQNLSVYKDLNQEAMNYSKRSHNKAPLLAKNLKVRLINENNDYRIISQFLLSESTKSFK